MPKEPVLENAVMEVLWDAPGPLTTREVRERLSAHRVAYTTVMTVLVRLWNKGQVEREKAGRAYAYRPRQSKEEHTAARMEQMLDTAGDRHAALSRFVETLSASERRQLKGLLEDQ